MAHGLILGGFRVREKSLERISMWLERWESLVEGLVIDGCDHGVRPAEKGVIGMVETNLGEVWDRTW